MKTWKKIAIVGTVAIGAIGLFAYQKKQKLKAAFDKMTFSVSKLSNFDISTKRIKFRLAIKLQNNTANDFSISTMGAVKLRNIYAFAKNGKLIGSAKVPDLSEIKVTRYSSAILPEVEFNIALEDALNLILNQNFSSITSDQVLNYMDFVLDFNIAGKDVQYSTI
jgi:hypothetical protein